MTFFDKAQAVANKAAFDNPALLSKGLLNGGTGRSGEYVSFNFIGPVNTMRLFVYKDNTNIVTGSMVDENNGIVQESRADELLKIWHMLHCA